jgi:hypothetical protein
MLAFEEWLCSLNHRFMRLRILSLFFAVLLPINLFAQTTLPLAMPTPAATPPTTTGKESQFGPLLPFASGPNAGPIPVEINSEQTRFEGGIAVAEGDVVVRYADVTIYCDYAEYNPDTH